MRDEVECGNEVFCDTLELDLAVYMITNLYDCEYMFCAF